MIVALQFTDKSMEPSNRRYMFTLVVRLIHIKQTSNVRSDNNIIGHWICVVWEHNCF